MGNKLDSMAFLVVQALTNAVTAYVGQNTGANKPDRVRTGVRITVTAAMGWSLLMMLLLLPFGKQLISLFSPSGTVVEAGYLYLKGIMPFYALFSVFYVLNGAMRGAGNSVFPMMTSILSLIVLRVPMVYLLANRFGPEYMYYGVGIGWIGGFLVCVTYYLSGRWKRASLAEEPRYSDKNKA